MKGRRTFALVLIVAVGLLLPLMNVSKSNAASAQVSLSIYPLTYVAHAKGETFPVNVEIQGVANLTSYQFTVTYNVSLLKINQVHQGSFIPASILSHFDFQINASSGRLNVNGSINNPSSAISGSGSLALIIFEVIHSPEQCAYGPIGLIQTTLRNKASPITHDAVGSVYFFNTLGPDPPVQGRVIDVFTQKGGIGQSQPDGNFTLGEEVRLTANVTYNGFPVQQKLVAFEIQNPQGQSVVLRSGTTDQNGQTSITFRIPNDPGSFGTWTAIAVVEIAQETAWDIVTFNVVPIAPVGGYSTSVRRVPETGSWTAFQTVLAALSVLLMTAKFTKRKSIPLVSHDQRHLIGKPNLRIL